MSGNKQWQDSFTRKLDGLRSKWVDDFDRRLGDEVIPAFNAMAAFVADHGFRASSPVSQPDRHSFKFELAENAFVLMTLSHKSIDEVDMRYEYFTPGAAPGDLERSVQVRDVNRDWATAWFQEALDAFVGNLNGGDAAEGPVDLELLAV